MKFAHPGITAPVAFDVSDAALKVKFTPCKSRRRKKLHQQGEFRDCKHAMGSGLGCETDLDVEEHLLVQHPATRAQVKKRKTRFALFLGDTASSEDIKCLALK